MSECHSNFCAPLAKEGQIKASDCEQNKAVTFAIQTNDSFWENVTRNWVLFNAYTGESTRKSIGYSFEGPCYLSRNDHDRKIMGSKQRGDSVKYSFVNRTIKLWNQLYAEPLATFSCKSHTFRMKVKKVMCK